MRFLLRKSWTRNWVKCVSLPAEVAKPRDTQLCTRCFRGWGTLCAAEELMDVVEGVPWGSSLAAGGNWAFLSWLLFWLRLLEGHWLCGRAALGLLAKSRLRQWTGLGSCSVREHRELCLPCVCILPFPPLPSAALARCVPGWDFLTFLVCKGSPC